MIWGRTWSALRFWRPVDPDFPMLGGKTLAGNRAPGARSLGLNRKLGGPSWSKACAGVKVDGPMGGFPGSPNWPWALGTGVLGKQTYVGPLGVQRRKFPGGAEYPPGVRPWGERNPFWAPERGRYTRKGREFHTLGLRRRNGVPPFFNLFHRIFAEGGT